MSQRPWNKYCIRIYFLLFFFDSFDFNKTVTKNFPLSIIVGGKKHKLEKHIHDIVDIKENKETDLYKAHLEIRKL